MHTQRQEFNHCCHTGHDAQNINVTCNENSMLNLAIDFISCNKTISVDSISFSNTECVIISQSISHYRKYHQPANSLPLFSC